MESEACLPKLYAHYAAKNCLILCPIPITSTTLFMNIHSLTLNPEYLN
jgi:hypothetical protein